MGCKFDKCASTSPDQPPSNWLRCLRRFGRWKNDMKVHPGVPKLNQPAMPRVILLKEAPETTEPIRLTPPAPKEQPKISKPEVNATKPETSEAILADLRSSGIIMETSTATGCSFEVPMGETQVVQRPPARLAKLAKTPKVKKTREQKEQELRAKLRDAEKRRQDLENQFRERMRELDQKRQTHKTALASTEDSQKLNLETKMLAKQAMAASIKEEQLEERLQKIQARNERRNKVLQKKRSSHLKLKISRDNKVTPLLSGNHGTRPATPYPEYPGKSDATDAPKVYTPSQWNSMFGAISSQHGTV